jgi:hypothetical protein
LFWINSYERLDFNFKNADCLNEKKIVAKCNADLLCAALCCEEMTIFGAYTTRINPC